MTKLHKEITKKAQCNVLDLSLTDAASIRKDLIKRQAKLQKNLEKAISKGWDTFCIEDSIQKIKATLEVI